MRKLSREPPQLPLVSGERPMTFGTETLKLIDQVVEASGRFGGESLIVLSGVAGTGKTLIALAAAQRLSGHPLFVKQIQFHQAYSYEDFVEGLRPSPSGGFSVRDGIFVHWNDAALRDPGNKYVLLIEEFTRTNISAVLGELMTYVEHRNREFELPISRRSMRVAHNLVFMSTMNPQDRSALEVDDALLRRLRIIECPPSVSQLREMLTGRMAAGLIDAVAKMFEECGKIFPDFNEMMPFGHGMFAGVTDEAGLRALWHQRIKHLLRRSAQVPAHPFAKTIDSLYPWK